MGCRSQHGKSFTRTHVACATRDAGAVSFRILGFHSDGGIEYVNSKVAKLLKKQQIDFTRSRPQHCSDNALAESTSGYAYGAIFNDSKSLEGRREQILQEIQ